MSDFSKYDLDLEKYIEKLPSYLQTPGSVLTGQIRLLYDIMNNYKNTMIELWSSFDINLLLNEYLIWVRDNPTLSNDDANWSYTEFVENLCKTYDVIREHPEGILKNSHMLRLLNIKTMGVGFDGSREKLEEILKNIFPTNTMYVIQNHPTLSATANVFLFRNPEDSSFNLLDETLFQEGFYFLKLLGITLIFDIIDDDALIYDLTTYSQLNIVENKYDGGTE